MKNIKIGLVVGHSKKSQGASNSNGITEFAFNNMLALQIKRAAGQLKGLVDVEVIYRKTYRGLPKKINKRGVDYCISLHCNAYNTRVSGTEVLYYTRSRNGKKLANVLQNNLLDALGLFNRGPKPTDIEDRGGYLLKYTRMPCVISEPFFIDNQHDLAIALDRIELLVEAHIKTFKDISNEANQKGLG